MVDVRDFTMTIDGAAVSSEGTFGVVNPATGEVWAQAPDCTDPQLDAAMASAATAYAGWRADESARREVLLAASAACFAAADEIAPVLTAEQGKPLGEAVIELKTAGVWLKYYARLEVPREVIQDDERAFVEVVRRPLGVVAAITPWNFPVSLASWKIAPALLAGNTMVLKPSPFTPLSTLLLGEVLRGVLPPGVLNVVSGADPLGAKMTGHAVPRKISFTGSVATGKKVAAAARPTSSGSPSSSAATTRRSCSTTPIPPPSPTSCSPVRSATTGRSARPSSVYVPEALYADVVDALAERANAAKVGDGAVEGTQLGPINNRPQFERVKELVADAIDHGARVVAGGGPIDGPGYFFAPTILADVEDGTRIVDEEQFGPALPVIAYRDLDDAVERANATHFGLSGSVWGADADRAAAVAERLECGTAWVNTHLALAPHQPFGGAKWSGIGVENGPWGFFGFTEIQVVHRARS